MTSLFRRLCRVRGGVVHWTLCMALGVGGALPQSAAAQDAYACLDELPDDEVSYRTRSIVRQFQAHERHTRWWRFGWIGVFVGTSIVELGILGPRSSGAQRWNAYISGAGATTALIQIAALPMPGVWARRRIQQMPTDTPEQRREQLRYALEKLESAANAQRIVTSPLSHVSALVWSATWGTVLTVKFDAPFVSAIGFLGGPLLNEARILTSPQWSRLSWERARGGMCMGTYVEDNLGDPYWDEPQTEARIYPTLGGLGLRLTF